MGKAGAGTRRDKGTRVLRRDNDCLATPPTATSGALVDGKGDPPGDFFAEQNEQFGLLVLVYFAAPPNGDRGQQIYENNLRAVLLWDQRLKGGVTEQETLLVGSEAL